MVDKITPSNHSVEKLKNRVYEVSVADLSRNEDLAYRKLKFKCNDYQNGSCLTGFYGMELTRDKLCSLVRKWQTIIDSFVDIKTKDGYFLRIFVIAFSRRKRKQIKKCSYFNSSQVRTIRRKIIEIVSKESLNCNIKEFFEKFNSEKLSREIEQTCIRTTPLQNVFIKKVKVLEMGSDL
mmetsp:Transcript_51564/g.104967  ORF Transcript_51564/g.104967 Transcript_51564/m.104967 type:complete len:179 (+) Transcript_51564:205-741(+)